MKNFLDIAKEEFGTNDFTRQQVKDLCDQHEVPVPRWLLNDERYRVARGVYNLREHVNGEAKQQSAVPPITNSNAESIVDFDAGLVPQKDSLYVKFGHFKLLSKIIESKMFWPVYIAGLSGNGKTVMVEQACAEHRRELYRLNITIETDEDDLLGGFRLVNDSTKWFDGPVVRAMRSGGILLLDEVNLASTKIMCLQPVLEGKGVFLKKINQFVKPAPGFNIIATANTKGQGDDTGKFVGSNHLNEAFLERFPGTIEQDYPTAATEAKILTKIFDKAGLKDYEPFVNVLTKWAETNRQAYKNDSATEVITTRRLIHIATAYIALGDQHKALDICLSRFDSVTKESFIELFRSLDNQINKTSAPVEENIQVEDDVFSMEDLLGTRP